MTAVPTPCRAVRTLPPCKPFRSRLCRKRKRCQSACDLQQTGGKVIATGGGAVLDPENVRALKQNGTIVFLDRAPENLIATDDRPLASRRSALEKLYAERYDIYTAAAEVHIDANTTPEAEADAILKELGE